jgi:holliday junction DNA helicase RuvB
MSSEDDFSDPDVREVSPALTSGEGDIDVSLRPRSLREFIGQPRVREQLQLVIEGPRTAAAHRITFCCRGRRG